MRFAIVDQWEVSVDYVSVSYPVNQIATTLGAMTRRAKSLNGGVADKIDPVRFAGYSGVKIGSARVLGKEVDKGVFRRYEIVSGRNAENWRSPVGMSTTFGVSVNRIDVALTVVLHYGLPFNLASQKVEQYIESVKKSVLQYIDSATSPTWTKRTIVRMISSIRNGNGSTLYIGSRQSGRFWRVYNKTAEGMLVGQDGLSPAVARFEVELKDEWAVKIAQLWEDTGYNTYDLLRYSDDLFPWFTIEGGPGRKKLPSWMAEDQIPWFERRLRWLESMRKSFRELEEIVGREEIIKRMFGSE